MPNGRLCPEQVRPPIPAREIRFTAKDGLVHARLMAWPADGKVLIRLLPEGTSKITGVLLLGSPAKPDWQQTLEVIFVKLPGERSC